jgi:hypothetical protein
MFQVRMLLKAARSVMGATVTSSSDLQPAAAAAAETALQQQCSYLSLTNKLRP